MKKAIKIIITVLLILAVLGAAAVFGANAYVKASAKEYILDPSNAGEGYDCILVLGCGVYDDNPSHMLRTGSCGVWSFIKTVRAASCS